MTDSKYKFAIVLNKKIPSGSIINAAAHMAAVLVSKTSPNLQELMRFVDYQDADGATHPVSACSLIVLQADNSNKIRLARMAAQDSGIQFVDFLETMTKDTYVEQLERTKALKEQDLEYWGLAMFASADELAPITKKFSLWR